ncbi:glycoside hydrolase family 2 TIM barrel-domain containing protein [Parapedobacter indicus]|uniref:beta-galactosidase n=1 Tax=Parapedobacter indicus TaxID=1477437 RepID=A0A1I3IFN4_9SPHI|nr:glycoside hydrolase family 2 TIM barrel-domain containing protein [Parapedobacter indicus]PPL02148.1 beta-galactosidase/beta-glucuronidase [Parapedobacter indicus]SFI46778.1 Beta-galactosidase/beta-glucuronidase [Parapedobacter indicus]
MQVIKPIVVFLNMKRLFSIVLLVLPVLAVAQWTNKVVYLSGTGADNRVDWEFYCSKGRNSGKWTTIPVPSCWEQEGFGGYYYGYGSGDRFYETGRYRHTFDVPFDWQGKVIHIVFEGVMTDAEVKINGKLAGPVHQGAFYQFSYDISSLLKYGTSNKLEVGVKKHSDNKSVNQAERHADYWVFGGIFRPVYLEVKPKTHIERVAIDARADGTFNADVYIANPELVHQVQVSIQSNKGTENAVFEARTVQETTRITGQLHHPETWSPEFPNLYQATFSLLDKNGRPLHVYTERIGFRTVEVRESDGIYINGVRVKLKGVNRHTFHPKYGRTSSKALSITALNLMKDMNMNAVRMSHYPPDKHFLEVCDSLGLFVLDELSGWQHPPYDDTVGKKLLTEMIARDVNHPSIILWDNGNEGGWNTSLDDDFAKLDIQQRQVLHPWQDFGLFNTYHYMGYNYLANDGYSRRKLFMPTEFLHGLYDGGHGAGLEDYWHRMSNDPLCTGGFLWVFADEAVERTDRDNQLDTYGNEAPDGIVGPYNEKEGSFYTIKDVWSPIYFEKRYITPAFDGSFHVENRFHFTNFSACRFTAEWITVSAPGKKLQEQVNATADLSVNVHPGQSGLLQLDLPTGWQSMDILRIHAVDPHGRLINTWSWPLKTASDKTNELIPVKSGSRPVVAETQDTWQVQTGAVTFAFSKKNGLLTQVDKAGQRIPLSNGPIWVNNKKEVEAVTQRYDANDLVIETQFEGDDGFRWTINGDGLLDLVVKYEPAYSSDFAGITFSYPEQQVAGMTWLGNGPYRVYKNRMKGARFGLWEKAYNNTVTGESGYVYPEFKGYHANTYWARIEGKGTPDFTVYVHSDDIFLRMLTPQEPQKPENAKMVYPEGDLSFLHTINGIGDKFMEAKELGPQAHPATFKDSRYEHHRLFIHLTFNFN